MARLIVLASLLVGCMMAGTGSLVRGSPMSDLSIFNYNPVANPSAVVTIGNARFTALTPSIVRMEYSNTKGSNGAIVFEDRATQTFVNRNQVVPQVTTKQQMINGVNTTVISTQQVTVYYQTGQPFTATSLTATLANGATWSYGDVDNGNLLGTIRSLDELCTISLNCTQNADTQIHDESLHCSWGVVSTSGWTTIDDSNGYIMSSAANSWFNTSNQNTDVADVYILGHGSNYRLALQEYTNLAGKPPLVRRQMLGAWWTRWYDFSNYDVERLIETFEQYQIPLDVLVLDMNWHTKNDWTGYSFDRELYPTPAQTVDYVHRKNLMLAANLHDADGIGYWEDSYNAMCKATGINPTSGVAVPFEPLSAQFIHALEDVTLKPLGIDTYWIDWQQGGYAGMCTNDDMNPTFITNHVRMTNSIRRGEKVRDSILARWGGSGSHRYPVGFSGDVNYLTWECFAFQPYYSITAANVAFGTISHDLVGPADDHELHVRWMQFGAYSGIMRIHDRGMSAGSCWDDCPNVNIWRLPADYFNPIRNAMIAREALLPYIYTENRKAYDTGVPLTYPMYYDFPQLADAYLLDGTGTWAQYMFGPNILVSPVTATKDDDTGLASKNIWLPPGTWWDDIYGHLVTVSASNGQRILQLYDLTEVPIFFKAGCVVPRLSNPTQLAAGSQNFQNIDMYIYPGGNSGSYSVYDDDGNTYDYVTSPANVSYTTMSYTRPSATSLTIKIQAPSNSFISTRSARVFIVASQPIASVTVNGAAVPYSIAPTQGTSSFRYDGPTVTAIITIASQPANTDLNIAVTLVAPQNDANLAGLKGYGYRAPLAKHTLDNFRTTPYSTTVGPGVLKQSGARGTYLSYLADPSNIANLALFQLLIGDNYTQLITNAITEINSDPSPAPAGPTMTALVQLWSPSRQDMLLCGSEVCLSDNSDYDYIVFGIEGYQPLTGDSAPYATDLYDYWDGQSDNWVDVTPVTPDGYSMAVFQNGYVVSKDVPNSGSPYSNFTCLSVWFNPDTNDHFTFATAASLAFAQSNGYTEIESCIAYSLVQGPAASPHHAQNRPRGMKAHSLKAKAEAAAAELRAAETNAADTEAMAWAEGVMRAARERKTIKQGSSRQQVQKKPTGRRMKNVRDWTAAGYATNLLSSLLPQSNVRK